MATKVISGPLNAAFLRSVITLLTDYKAALPRKMEEFATRLVSEVGIPTIDARIAAAKGDSSDAHDTAFVISRTATGIKGVVTVKGEDIVFIEFGAGIHYNTPAGTSPHDKGVQFGYTIGSYGQGRGRYDWWYYKDDSGALVRSQGTQATMPLLTAVKDMRGAVVRIAREVFA